MRKNVTKDFKARLKAGDRLFCAMMGPGNDPDKTVAALKEYGYDYVILDNEHSLVGKESIYRYIRACHENELPLIMRPEEKTDSFRCYLDSGVNGMMLPQVDTVEQAAYGVNQSYFPPIGHRGAGLGMSPYLLNEQKPAEMRLLEMLEYVNDNTMLFPMMESLEGISNLSHILKLEGVTGTLVGGNDLTIDIIFKTGQISPDALRSEIMNNSYVLERVKKIAEICKKAGKVAGIGGYPPKAYVERAKEGYQLFTVAYVANDSVEKIRPLLAEVKGLMK